MNGAGRRGGLGWPWLLLMAVPPVVVVSGLVAMFWWQGSKDGIQPKWRKSGVEAGENLGVEARTNVSLEPVNSVEGTKR